MQVAPPFAGTDRIRRSETPSGRAVHVVHWGDYAKLLAAYVALEAFLGANDLRVAERWEVYGDWSQDAAKLRTDVYGRLL